MCQRTVVFETKSVVKRFIILLIVAMAIWLIGRVVFYVVRELESESETNWHIHVHLRLEEEDDGSDAKRTRPMEHNRFSAYG